MEKVKSVPIYISMLKTSRMCSLLLVVLFFRHVENSIVTKYCCQVTQYLSGSKHTAAVDHLKRSARYVTLIGESSGTSSSAPSKICHFCDICAKHVSRGIPLFQTNNPVARHFLLKYTETDSPDDSILRKGYLL
jgi:hypothetical protein